MARKLLMPNDFPMEDSMKIPALVAALLLSPLIAQAGVLYEWRALNHETPYGITLRLEFDNGTLNSGAFSFHHTP